MTQLIHGHTYQAGVNAPFYATSGAIQSKIEAGGFTNVSVSQGGSGGANYTATGTWGGADGNYPQPAEVISVVDMTPGAPSSSGDAPAAPSGPAASAAGGSASAAQGGYRPPSDPDGGGDQSADGPIFPVGRWLVLAAIGAGAWYYYKGRRR